MTSSTYSSNKLSLVVSDICGLRRMHEDDKSTTEATLGYLQGNVRWLVYLARGCDTFDVGLCAGRLGR